MRLVGGDLSNIEGRIAAWLADERWKLQAFRDYDAGTGPDLYLLTASRVTGKPIEAITKAERQAQGKVSELSLTYQGSVGAYLSMAANYLVRPGDVARAARAATSDDVWDATRAEYTKAFSHGLDPETWTGIKVVVNGYRAANPNIVQSWWDLQDAAIDAVANPGCIVPVLNDRVRYKVDRGFLWCKLPSGRVLAYAAPRIVWVEKKRADGSTSAKRQVEYEGVDSVTKRWGPQRLYGGLQFENIDQAIARDVIVEAMFRAETAGFPIILTVHDEILAEVEDVSAGHTAETLEALMCVVPKWAPGLPLAAKAWEDKRYVK